MPVETWDFGGEPELQHLATSISSSLIPAWRPLQFSAAGSLNSATGPSNLKDLQASTQPEAPLLGAKTSLIQRPLEWCFLFLPDALQSFWSSNFWTLDVHFTIFNLLACENNKPIKCLFYWCHVSSWSLSSKGARHASLRQCHWRGISWAFVRCHLDVPTYRS